jgi:hypothetical protein
MHSRENLLDAHFLAAVESVRRVAPRAAQVAPREPHENARQSRPRAFSLDGTENFGDGHGAPLSAPARLLSPLVPVDQKQRHTDYDRRSDEAKGLDGESTPMKQIEVADAHGDGRQNHDEERAIHSEVTFVDRGYGQYVAEVVSVSQMVTRAIRAPAGMPFICRKVWS